MWVNDYSSFLFNGILIGTLLTHIIYHDSVINHIYQTKIIKLEKKIEKLEEFRIYMYEQNLILNEKRQWDSEISEESDESDHSSLIDDS
jgi:hypothetical protein